MAAATGDGGHCGAGAILARSRGRYPEPVSESKKSQTMKPSTAAQKLDVYLPATPAEFRAGVVSRDELNELQHNPPQWLVELRRNGPHPRSVIAARLRISNSGLARGGITEALTTAQIADLVANPPSWVFQERAKLAETRREDQRVKEQRAKAQRVKEQRSNGQGRDAGQGRPAVGR